MISWRVSYLAKGPRPDFNNGSEDKLNYGHILAPGVYSSLTRIMAHLQVILILARWKIFLFRCPLMVSWWVQYLAEDLRLDFNNRPWDNDFNNHPWDNLNSGHILADCRLFESDSNNGPSSGHIPNLGQMEGRFVRSLTYGLLVGAIYGQEPQAWFQ